MARYIDGRRIGECPPPWLEEAYAAFESVVLAEGYPCYFGSQIVRSGDLFFAAVEENRIEHLPETLATFLTISGSLRGRKNNLAIFFKPFAVDFPHDRYFGIFWDVLQYLHEHDPLAAAIPPCRPEESRWEFPFGGEQLFVVGASPSYRYRRSRNLGNGLIMIFQPRDVFDDPESGGPVSAASREAIHTRLAQWDKIGPHPDLGGYGDAGKLEWKQYFLPDGAERVSGRCPLRARTSSSTSPQGTQGAE